MASGVVVANIDSGVDWLAPGAADHYRGLQPPRSAPAHLQLGSDATGDGGHSTRWTATATATHTMGNLDRPGGIGGGARAARWMAARAFNTEVIGLESWVACRHAMGAVPGPGCAATRHRPAARGAARMATMMSTGGYAGAAAVAGIFCALCGRQLRTQGAVPLARPPVTLRRSVVGAVTGDDSIAAFSGRGPSVWYENILAKTRSGSARCRHSFQYAGGRLWPG